MKFSISNMRGLMKKIRKSTSLCAKKKFVNLEIASSKIFGENPYDNLEKVAQWKNNLNFKISSIHSIWYGRTEKFFGTYSQHKFLLSYTKKLSTLRKLSAVKI